MRIWQPDCWTPERSSSPPWRQWWWRRLRARLSSVWWVRDQRSSDVVIHFKIKLDCFLSNSACPDNLTCQHKQFVQRVRIGLSWNLLWLSGLSFRVGLFQWFFYGKVTSIFWLCFGFENKNKNEFYFAERLWVSDEEKKRPSEKSVCEYEEKYSDEPEVVRGAGSNQVCPPVVTSVSLCQSRGLVWCPVYKAASTNWCHNLLHLAGRSPTEVERIIASHP